MYMAASIVLTLAHEWGLTPQEIPGVDLDDRLQEQARAPPLGLGGGGLPSYFMDRRASILATISSLPNS